MAFVKYKGVAIEYQGESFTKNFYRGKNTDGSYKTWETTDVLTYEMVDNNGEVVSSGDVSKVENNEQIKFSVPSEDTASLNGRYLLLVHLKNSEDATFNDVIIEFSITYETKKAPK